MARPQHRRITLRRKFGRGFLALLVAGVAVVVTVGFLAYRHLDGNITSLDTTEALGTDRPAPVAPDEGPHKPLNILLIGSDSRKGQTEIKGQTPGLSDTTILVHINAARTTITGVSLPRDSMVQRPDCLSRDGETTIPGELAMFNTAYAIGGVGCTQRTVEQLTNVRIDHFAVIDLAGFVDMVDAIGGVPICVPHEVNDTIGDIHLPAGSYLADGDQALGYVRERHTLSANGDLGRMKRQQAFLSAMVAKVLSSGTLGNPVRLYRFLDAATGSLTTDPDLASLGALADLASELKDIQGDQVRFLTVPVQTYAPDPNRLEWTPEAGTVWESFRYDKPLPHRIRDQARTSDQSPGHRRDDARTREADDNGLCT